MIRQCPLIGLEALSQGKNIEKGDDAESQNLRICSLNLNSCLTLDLAPK